MFNRAQKKFVDHSIDQGEKIVGEIGKKGTEFVDKSTELVEKTGKWVQKNDQALLGIVALTLGMGVFSYLLTRGRRFIIIV